MLVNAKGEREGGERERGHKSTVTEHGIYRLAYIMLKALTSPPQPSWSPIPSCSSKTPCLRTGLHTHPRGSGPSRLTEPGRKEG